MDLKQLEAHLEKLDPASTKGRRERDFGHKEWEGVIDLFAKQHYIVKVRKLAQIGNLDRPVPFLACSVFALGFRTKNRKGKARAS